ncbi:uncharacterized protein PHALS_13686 [Plasmopara halstedii]|uniref:LicD n=1 Tax=Plasmopara halstedii TaxID=4781 RepID=A0A0P1AQL6_PLAHL|nr:uncharacterized protein PHALS_13686 [Plasmopara halstedii]CEG43493.1 hypothetical protein PHALS_13686 [Plasmopara halstedii]|eukprot:XP_024579862.1 hypothetical protein PHALS_13686 [Plasmopara halstedii]
MAPNKNDSNGPVDGVQAIKVFSRGMTLLFVTLLLATVVACDIAMKMNILSNHPRYFLPSDSDVLANDEHENTIGNNSQKGSFCSPRTVNVSAVEYHSHHRYYTLLKDSKFESPRFKSHHAELCNNSVSDDIGYKHCLPISGRKDSPFCTGADRMDLLTQHTSQSRCYASVLHMLLVEVYEELHAFNKTPLVVYGSLLGAVRNQSMIPFTEDTDIAYIGHLDRNNELGQALVSKGYHFFFFGIWRVCVAPTHPLASILYDSQMSIAQDYLVPYVDLYAMEKLNETDWSLEMFGSNTIPAQFIEPFSQVSINGLPFNTVHDPHYFLTTLYGEEYMSPKPRY